MFVGKERGWELTFSIVCDAMPASDYLSLISINAFLKVFKGIVPFVTKPYLNLLFLFAAWTVDM